MGSSKKGRHPWRGDRQKLVTYEVEKINRNIDVTTIFSLLLKLWKRENLIPCIRKGGEQNVND